MSSRRKILTLIVIVLLAVAIVLAVLSISNQRKISQEEVVLPPVDNNAVETNLPNQTAVTDKIDESKENFIAQELSQAEKEKNFLLKTASAFAERYGSYSNQSNYENLKDLKVFMTAKMWAWAESTVNQGAASQPSPIYYGITSRALNSQITSQTAAKASVKVSTQRQESIGSQVNSKVIYKDILIVFEKEGGVWKVAGAYWQ